LYYIMSEVKTNEPVKQEGEFKLKTKKKTPKKLNETKDNVTKVNVNPKEPLVELEPDVKKVIIPKQENDAIQIGETEKVSVEESSGDSKTVGEPVQESNETTEGFSPIQEVTEAEVKQVEAEVKEAVRDEKVLGKPLPENIEKLVSFMEETGGTIEDYTRLNADYSSIDDVTLLKEYYKKNKPYLESDDIDLLLEDFVIDEDIDEERDARKKKLAFKEEVAKAKNFLEETKSKYYDEIKLRPGVTQEQQKAMDFFNRYNKQQEQAEQQHQTFKDNTKKLFSDDFKGFDISVGEKKYKYNIQNKDKVAENQSNITNLVGKFLDENGNVKDVNGYHKAMYAAENVDKIASHFYEQGKADAVKDVVNKSKNLTDTKARTSQGDVFIDGFKVKAISGADSTKLKIKTRKFN
ncbi:hypothetical protein, partial [Idiomarina sp.]|uniref:hypothetical protein n=1 Tax=Idiomarina sp. TaxID=1874361 RepID=UPI00257E43A2